jgi:hypothetical protein
MSDFHILTQDIERKVAQCVFHIPIPVGDNSANITWAAAVVREQGGANAISSVLPDISAEEESALKAGTILERRLGVRFSSKDLTNTQRLAEIEAAFTTEKAAIQAEKQITLDFIGHEGDVI